jgi:hypothetical protein
MVALPHSDTITMDDAALSDWADGLTTRIGLQAELVWVGLNDGYADAGGQDVAIPWLGLWWSLGPVKTYHCSDCPAIAMGSPYDPPGTPGGNVIYQSPGDGRTACGAGCHCWLEYGLPRVSLPRTYAWRNGVFPGPGKATVEGAGGATATQYGWNEAMLLDPESENFTDEQKGALDLFRAKWFAWEEIRGDLPQAPKMFEGMDAAQDLADLDAFWDQMTAQQRDTLIDLQEAIGAWNEATNEATAAANDETLAPSEIGADIVPEPGAADATVTEQGDFPADQFGMTDGSDAIQLFSFGGFRIGGGPRGGLGGVGEHADLTLYGPHHQFAGRRPGGAQREHTAASIHEHLTAHRSEEGGGGSAHNPMLHAARQRAQAMTKALYEGRSKLAEFQVERWNLEAQRRLSSSAKTRIEHLKGREQEQDNHNYHLEQAARQAHTVYFEARRAALDARHGYRLTGDEHEVRQLYTLFGSPRAAHAALAAIVRPGKGEEVYVSGGVEMRRGLRVDFDGRTHLINFEIGRLGRNAQARMGGAKYLVHDPYVRSTDKNVEGGRELLRALSAMRVHGVGVIRTGGARGDKFNGYDTWAKLGGVGRIPKGVLSAACARFGRVSRVEQIMDRPGGRQWWKEHGDSWNLRMELFPGGRTARILDALMARMNSAGRSPAGATMGEGDAND